MISEAVINATELRIPQNSFFLLGSLCIFLPFLVLFFVFFSSMTKNNSKVQALYDHCNNTLTSSPSPSPQVSQSICSLLGISQFLSFLLINCILFYMQVEENLCTLQCLAQLRKWVLDICEFVLSFLYLIVVSYCKGHIGAS